MSDSQQPMLEMQLMELTDKCLTQQAEIDRLQKDHAIMDRLYLERLDKKSDEINRLQALVATIREAAEACGHEHACVLAMLDKEFQDNPDNKGTPMPDWVTVAVALHEAREEREAAEGTKKH